MIELNGTAVICDFGCARAAQCSLSLAKLTSSPRGTPTYWAPELFGTQANNVTAAQSEETDVWAFGMAIYVRGFSMFGYLPSHGLLGDYHAKTAIRGLDAESPCHRPR